MRTFRWQSASGKDQEIKATSVEFAPGHVVFKDPLDRVVWAEANSNVHKFYEKEATRHGRDD